MGYAVLFPGQGSQSVGMGAELFELRPDLLGDPADEVLGWSLREACLTGSEEQLKRTDRAQPALFAVAYALWTELAARLDVRPSGAAGHSLGEYTAHAAAGTFEFLDGLQLVHQRGRAMEDAARLEPSGMAALLGVDGPMADEVASERRRDGGRMWVANFNAPGQVVVAGGADDLTWLDANARALGMRRVIPLNVAGAFHSPFMDPAVSPLRVALDRIEISEPLFPVWANVSAEPAPYAEISESLARQVVAPVRFSETLHRMQAQGIDLFVHVGPGDVTAAMARRAAPGANVVTVSSLSSLDSAAGELSEAFTMTDQTRRD